MPTLLYFPSPSVSTLTTTRLSPLLDQGASEYTTCDNLLHKSSSTYPGSSLFEIAAQGIPLKKLVIGKPSAKDQAENG